MKRYIIVGILSLFYFTSQLWGQASPLFHNVSVPEALGVYCMAKDEKGLLWMGTGDGLYCYDGYRCYRRTGVQDSVPNGIQTLHIDHNTIYLGADNGY